MSANVPDPVKDAVNSLIRSQSIITSTDKSENVIIIPDSIMSSLPLSLSPSNKTPVTPVIPENKTPENKTSEEVVKLEESV